MRWLALALLLLLPGAAHAACPAVPFIFTTTRIDPSQVNQNFSALRSCITQNVAIAGVTNTQAVRDLTAGVYASVQRSYNASPGDGAAIYYWNATSACTDDGQTCIKPTSNPATGRWVLSSEVANSLLLNPGGGTNFSFNSTSQISRQTFNAATSGAAGATPTDQNNAALVWYRNTGTMTGSGVGHGIANIEFDYNDSGVTVNNDSFVGAAANCNLLGTRPNAGIVGGTLSAACIGGSIGARGYTSQGGNLGTGQPQGEIHGLNVVAGVSIGPGPTTPLGYNDHEGIEIDMTGCVGCTVNHRLGLYVLDYGNGGSGLATQGSLTDSAIAIGSVNGTVGWLIGINFVGMPITGGNALSNTGTVLGSNAATPVVATNGIDLNNFSISGKAFRAPGDTWYVTGAGDQLANSVTTGVLIVDLPVASNTVTEYRVSGVGKWDAGREGTSNDYIVKNLATGSTVVRVTTASDIMTIGAASGMSIDATGGVSVPGGGMIVGAPTGGLQGAGTINIATALYFNGTIGATCGPGAPTAGFTVFGGIVLAC